MRSLVNRMGGAALVCAMAVVLSGCGPGATFPKLFGSDGVIARVTAPITNPVSANVLAGIESAVITARSGVLVYLAAPRCQPGQSFTLTAPCSQPSIRLQIRKANRQVQIALVKARAFHKDNPTVTVAQAFTDVWNAIDDLKAAKAQANIPTPAN